MGNHQKLTMGVKVSAGRYSCQAHISGDKTDEARSCSDFKNPHFSLIQLDGDGVEVKCPLHQPLSFVQILKI